MASSVSGSQGPGQVWERKAKEESSCQAPGENISPVEIIVTVTPKKKGVKRIHTPGSGAPANRKKTRVKASLKSLPTEAIPANTNIESPPTTPTKRITRQARSSLIVTDTKSPSASSNDDHESDDDGADVEARPIARTSTSPLPPSDDLGGY